MYKLSQGVRKVPFDDYTEYWVNPDTGMKGGLIGLGRITWMGPFMARMEVNYTMNGYVLTVVTTASGWRVINRQMSWQH